MAILLVTSPNGIVAVGNVGTPSQAPATDDVYEREIYVWIFRLD